MKYEHLRQETFWELGYAAVSKNNFYCFMFNDGCCHIMKIRKRHKIVATKYEIQFSNPARAAYLRKYHLNQIRRNRLEAIKNLLYNLQKLYSFQLVQKFNT